MGTKLIKILVVDDHTLVRQGIKMIIEEQPDMKVIAEAANGSEGIRLVLEYNPDIVLLDIKMPKLNGLEVLSRIKDLGIKSKVIIVSAYSDKSYLIEAVKIGALGYLTKGANNFDLIKAIRDVYSGHTYLQSSIANVLSKDIDLTDHSDLDLYKIGTLSKREYEILGLISSGYNNKRIGEELFVSEKTVKNHITSIYKKLDVDNRVGAVIFAYENQLIKTINK